MPRERRSHAARFDPTRRRLLRAVGAGLAGALCAARTPLMAATRAPAGRIHALFAFDTSIEPSTFARSCREWGLDTAILHPGFLRDDRMASALDEEGIALWLNLPVFFNQEYLERRPEECSITSRGRRAVREWLHFVCPSRETYRDSLLRDLRDCLSRVQPKVVSLDFIRHFVFWEGVPLDGPGTDIEDGCYCPVCLGAFARECEESLDATSAPARVRGALWQQWGDWKCREIASFANRLFDEVRALAPGARLSIKTVPWRESDLGGAIRSVAGQDLRSLAAQADLVSPMAFTHELHQTPGWKRGLLGHVAAVTGKPVLSYVQTAKVYRPEEIPPAQFEEELAEALDPGWGGLVVFEYQQLVADPAKAAILRQRLGTPRRDRA
jgi:hypothetical protein